MKFKSHILFSNLDLSLYSGKTFNGKHIDWLDYAWTFRYY